MPAIVEPYRVAAWGMFSAVVLVPLWYLASVFFGIWWFLIRRRDLRPWISSPDPTALRP